MSFNEYQQKSSNTFKPVAPLTAEQIHLLDWAMGLGGEAGEVLDLVKHAIFHKEQKLDKMELAKELGDVLWYVSAIATTCGIDLADVAALNNAKLEHRYNKGYSAEDSANRHAKEQALKDTSIYKCLEARILNTQNAPLTVIVVGPDGSGKTTFTSLLAEHTKMKRIKCDYRQPNKPQLAKHLLMTELDVIYDRFYYPDEQIYSMVKNMPLEDAYLEELLSVFDVLYLVNPVIIYIDADLQTLKERSKAWADDYVSTEDLSSIKNLYHQWLDAMRQVNVPIIEIDTSSIPIDSTAYVGLLDSVIELLNDFRKSYGTAVITSGGKENE